MYVCICSQVTEQEILDSNSNSVEDVRVKTGACNNCQMCYTYIEQLVKSETENACNYKPDH